MLGEQRSGAKRLPSVCGLPFRLWGHCSGVLRRLSHLRTARQPQCDLLGLLHSSIGRPANDFTAADIRWWSGIYDVTVRWRR